MSESRTNHLTTSAIASLAAFAAGCGGGTIEGSFDQDVSFQEFLSQTYYEADADVFIVDGDTPLEGEKQLREFFITYVQGDPLIVHRVNGADSRWSDSQKRNLTYCVSTTFGSRYNTVVAAMNAATSDWEASADIDYIHLSQYDSNCTNRQNNVVFDVRPVSSGGQYLARAFFPHYSRRSRNVLIDGSAYNSGWPLDGILKHELGHTLGFRHEHTRPESGACFEDSSWRPLTPYDSSSVMHYPQCNGTSELFELTGYDRQGAAALYGASGSEPPPPPTGTPRTESFSGSLARDQIVRPGPFAVVAGTTFEARMTGSGDADLYVRWGTAPSFTAYNCRPYLSSSNESCIMTVPSGIGEAHVMIHGYSSASYNLTVSYTAP